ncbi:MAG: protoglobin domain-containing protein [Myxococcota bacterium]
MSPEELRLRLAFLGFTDADRANLSELAPILEKDADSFMGAFYRHLLSFEPTRRLLADPDVKERVIAKQRAYLLSLGTQEVDEAYVEERSGIGMAHLQVGLGPGWYLGAYALYMSLLIPVIFEAWKHSPARIEAIITSLQKILSLDAQLAMEAYIARREEQLEFLNRELAAASRDLEGRLETRSQELRETTDRARAAEELASVATIVAGLAHEIGTPMGVIQGHAELLESSVSDERGRQRLQTIREQIERISSIIRSLLNMARSEGRERQPVELAPIVDRSLSFLIEKFRLRGIRLKRDLAAGVTIFGDDEKLQQLLLNLLLNAADAMPQGGKLEISLSKLDSGQAEILITDEGHGMAPEVLDRVFEPFYTTKAAGQGTGLGLVVANGIVRDHGGSIEATSEVGRGTQFRIVLPGLESA